MQNLSIVEGIVNSFTKMFEYLVNEGLITSETLDRYWDFSIHSVLQYSLIMAAKENGIIAVPEYKLRLSKPIDKRAIDPRLKVKQQYMRTLRVDVGFLVKARLVGIGEVYSPDEIHGCLPTRELSEPWVTPYHKLLHIAEHEESLEFLVLVIGLWKVSSWKDARRRSPEEWSGCWEGLVSKLAERKTVGAVFIKGPDPDEIHKKVLGQATSNR